MIKGCIYWIPRKEHKILLGPYPDLSLKDASIKCDELQEGADEWLLVRPREIFCRYTAMQSPQDTHKYYATLTAPAEIAILMRTMKAYPCTVMRCARLFLVYTFARSGEVCAAEWSEDNKRCLSEDRVRIELQTIGFHRDVIERQLEQVEENTVRQLMQERIGAKFLCASCLLYVRAS